MLIHHIHKLRVSKMCITIRIVHLNCETFKVISKVKWLANNNFCILSKLFCNDAYSLHWKFFSIANDSPTSIRDGATSEDKLTQCKFFLIR